MRTAFAATLIVMGVSAVTGAQNQPAAAAQAGQPAPAITVEGGVVSVRLRNASVRAALEELGRQIPVRITMAQNTEDAQITSDLTGVPIEFGLRTLLANYDTFFYYGGAGQDSSSLRGVWIFPKGTALTMQPASLQACAGGRELEAALADANPRVRQQAYDALMTRPDNRSRELVIQALRGGRERDDEVRQHIFTAALSRGFEIPPDVLSEIARADVSEHVRWMALDALSQYATAQQAAQAALSDTSLAVRQKAQEILTAFGAENDRQHGVVRPPEQQP
jgi:HEAT repeat protein